MQSQPKKKELIILGSKQAVNVMGSIESYNASHVRTIIHCSLFMHVKATNENAKLIPPCCAVTKPNVFQTTPEKKIVSLLLNTLRHHSEGRMQENGERWRDRSPSVV